MAIFKDRDGDTLSFAVDRARIYIESQSRRQVVGLLFDPATARQIAAALIEAADKAEAAE